jgi:hypothetical protein
VSETGAGFELITFSRKRTIDCSVRGLGGSLVGSFIPAALSAVDLRERAEEPAIDVSEDGGAARGNVVFREKLVKVAERVVDALGGLEALGITDEMSRRCSYLSVFRRRDGGNTDESAGRRQIDVIGGPRECKTGSEWKSRGISGL